MCENLVVVGIPIYKAKLSVCELVSLKQVLSVLKNYKIVFIAPQSLKFDYGEGTNEIDVERFQNDYFCDLSTYSSLLLSVGFYQRFSKYKFLLICQLDAFVFYDYLKKFCLLDYDYIGAPMGYVSVKKQWEGNIGNGGFSLRKVEACINLLKNTQWLLTKHPNRKKWFYLEDQFFSYCARHNVFGFKAASIKESLSFAFDSDARRCFYRNHCKLPFGSHAWYKNDYVFYKNIIEKYGYNLPQNVKNGNHDILERKFICVEFLFDKYMKIKKNRQILKPLLKEKFGENEQYVIFGAGNMGRRCFNLLKIAGIHPIAFWDNGEYKASYRIEGIEVRKPLQLSADMRSVRIVIAIKRSFYQVENQLIGMGYKKNISFFNLEKYIVRYLLKAKKANCKF